MKGKTIQKLELTTDPEFQTLIPPLSQEEFNALEKSIVDEGCRDPLVVWDNVLLDGHNRYTICMNHGLIFKKVEKNFDNRERAKIWILENQLGRRNLNEAQRIDVVHKLFGLKEHDDADYRMKHPTENLPEGSKGERRDKLGMKAKVSGRTYSKGIKIKENDPDLWQKCCDGDVSIDKASRQVDNEKKEEERKKNSKLGESVNVEDFKRGDFIKVLDYIPDGSVDLILTDPPYPIEYIDEWEKLGKFAKQKLKPNGFCICYSGQKNLFEVMKRLSNHLNYYWIFALVHKDNKQLINPRNIFCGWKPILIYQNGFKKLDDKLDDIIQGTGRSKKNHNWEQSTDELEYLINNFTKEGNCIVDPFVGSGTTLISVKKNNRIAIGAEIDKITFNGAKKRIHNELE